MLQPDLFKKVVNQIKQHTVYMTFYFQGEPYLNPNFLTMVSMADKAGIITSTSTNAHYLSKQVATETVKAGLKRLIISIDGTTQEVYEQYRKGGSLQKVIESTKNIIEARKQLKSRYPVLIFQFLVVKPNEHQINDIKHLAKELGVDKVVFKTAQIYNFEFGNPLIPENTRYSRYYRLFDGRYKIKNKLLNKCWKLWHSCVITWNGDVLPCCFDKDGEFKMGNVEENNFSTIWMNTKYRQFRKSLLSSRKEISICKNCTEGLNVFIDN
jgi:radical SAM protein with 4Fe4S-binding SPASM domain